MIEVEVKMAVRKLLLVGGDRSGVGENKER
jgi:hypothetical protein